VRVLVVEGEPYLAEAIRDGLRLEAIAADTAGDGGTALDLLSFNAYDIAVLDRDIPGPTGDEIAKRIVASGSGMPILMLTAADRLEPGCLVIETVGSGEHEDRHAAAGGDDALRDLVTGRAGDVSVEDGDVVGVEPQQLQSGVAVACDVGGDGFQAQAVADGFRHKGFVLADQHAHAPMLEPRHIAGISKNRYALTTRRGQVWRRDPQ